MRTPPSSRAFAWPTTRRGRIRTRLRVGKQSERMHLELIGEPDDGAKRQIALAPLYLGDVGALIAEGLGEHLL